MYLAKIRYQEINRTIAGLLEDYYIKETPISVKRLARKMGIVLQKYSDFSFKDRKFLSLASEDGFSYFNEKSKQYYILYNDQMAEVRIRFTIAHEIGHIVLNHDKSSKLAEYEADFFARNLLVPQALLISLKISSATGIEHLFNVSKPCSEIVFRPYSNRIRYRGYDLEDFEKSLVDLITIRRRK